MRSFDYKARYTRLLQPDIVSLVSKIHEQKVKQDLLVEAQAGTLTQLLERAKIQSTKASNKIEGIYISDDRLKKIVCDKTVPRTPNEKEIAGYRDVLNGIYENYVYMPAKTSVILQMHQDLYKFTGNKGGHFKTSDHIEAQTDLQGNEAMEFQSVEAGEVPEYMNAICEGFQNTCNDSLYDPLLVISMFILDFLCIHPFYAGNGRISRLLILLLLYRSEYTVGMYSSIEKLIEKTKESYYKALRNSSLDWCDESNNDLPFVRYMLEIIIAAYRDFSSKVQFIVTSGMSKPERVRTIVRDSFGKMTRADIMKKCPDISRVTVERTLTEMVKKQEILKIGGGRYTAYIWNREKE